LVGQVIAAHISSDEYSPSTATIQPATKLNSEIKNNAVLRAAVETWIEA
jgi:hypothetical protein